jgi:hypothetical protein
MHLDMLLLDFKDKTGARNIYIPGEVATGPVAVGNEDEDPKRCQSHVSQNIKVMDILTRTGGRGCWPCW